jgi:hypothetical protein
VALLFCLFELARTISIQKRNLGLHNSDFFFFARPQFFHSSVSSFFLPYFRLHFHLLSITIFVTLIARSSTLELVVNRLLLSLSLFFTYYTLSATRSTSEREHVHFYIAPTIPSCRIAQAHLPPLSLPRTSTRNQPPAILHSLALPLPPQHSPPSTLFSSGLLRS